MILLILHKYVTIFKYMEINQSQSHNSQQRESLSLKQTVAIGALTGLAIISTMEYIPTESRPELGSVERTIPPRVNDMQALLIDAPTIDSSSLYNEEYIKNVVDMAGGRLNIMTAGELTTPQNLPVHLLQLDPAATYQHASDAKVEKCYSSKQLQQARADYLAAQHLPDDSRVSIVLKDALSCYSMEKGAVAWADVNSNTRMAVYDAGFDDNIFLHEEGHLSGLGHAAAIDCSALGAEYNKQSRRQISKADIKDLIELGCTARKTLDNNDLKIDEYSSNASTMGSYHGIDRESDRYNFVELNRLTPDLVKDQPIGTDAGEYAISLKDHEVHMVTFTIAPDHPLRSIDPTIDRLSIGVNRLETLDTITPAIHIIAVGKSMTYELAYAFPYVLNYDKSTKDIELYHDETLGVKVLLNGGDDDQTVKVTVKPLESTILQ